MKICLIGSTRFMTEYAAANRRLTLLGHIVYTVAMMSTGLERDGVEGPSSTPTDEEKIILDLVHLRKIMHSDAVVLITDSSRYVGFSTRRELMWAQMLAKRIYWSQEDVPGIFFNGFGVEVSESLPKAGVSLCDHS